MMMMILLPLKALNPEAHLQKRLKGLIRLHLMDEANPEAHPLMEANPEVHHLMEANSVLFHLQIVKEEIQAVETPEILI